MRPMIETLDRVRPCDKFVLERYHLTVPQPGANHLIGKRVLVKRAAWVNDSILTAQLHLTVADPDGSLAGAVTITAWAGATADQWWYEGGQRRGSWRGPLNESTNVPN